MPLTSCPTQPAGRVGGGVLSAAYSAIQLAGVAKLLEEGVLPREGSDAQEIQDKTTMFWGVEVTSHSPLSVTAERSLHISKAVLAGPTGDLHTCPVDLLLRAEPEGVPIKICRFLPNVAESALDLLLGKGDSVTLSVGCDLEAATVHVTGYYTDEEEGGRRERLARADARMNQLVDICNRILERTYHIN